MRRSIPSLPSLLAFEAAARHLSFTDAGKELHLTQTAISHQIKKLEELLDTKLFVRRRNVLLLTAAGQQYLESVRDAINMLHSATNRTRREKTSELLTINCLPAYATQCLIPILVDFQEQHPSITLQVLTNQTFDQFKQRTYDVAFRYGSGRWTGLHAELLQQEEIVAVCTPSLAMRIDPSDPHGALSSMTQIRTYFSSSYQDDWPKWLETSGIGPVDFAREAIFNLQITSLQAAVNGIGIGLGRTPLIDRHLAAGSLCTPLDYRVQTGSGYYLVTPEDKIDQPKIQIFWKWALEKLQRVPAHRN